jgi:hypothetical protein
MLKLTHTYILFEIRFNSLNAELNPICHLLALLGAHHILHVGRIRVSITVFLVSRCFKIVLLPSDLVSKYFIRSLTTGLYFGQQMKSDFTSNTETSLKDIKRNNKFYKNMRLSDPSV